MNSLRKRLVKNTGLMYLRMTVALCVGVFTSREILRVLGITDFGIYNVVGGVVVMFSFLTNALQSATQCYLNIEMGRGDLSQARRVFSMSLFIHGILALLICVLAETIGLWYLNTKVNMPFDRETAAQWVFQFSVITSMIHVATLPYTSTVVAYERFDFYAYQNILVILGKLGIVYLVIIGSCDKLILYSFLMLLVVIFGQLITIVYCRRTFSISHFVRIWDWKLFQEMFSFSGWSLLGGVSNIANTQGINLVLNYFCGVGVNAAMGIANQVNTAVNQFVSGFLQSYAPQIVQSYVSDKRYFISLLFGASKISFFLMLFFALPVIVNMDFLLHIWLIEVPPYSIPFSKLILLYSIISTIACPLWMSVQATGKIRNYQLIVSCFIFSSFPIAYLLLKHGYSPIMIFAVRVIIDLLTVIWRIFYLKHKVGLPSWIFFFDVLLRCLVCGVLASFLPFWLASCFSGWNALFISGIASVASVILCCWVIGLTSDEREWLTIRIKGHLHTHFKSLLNKN